MIFIIGVQIHWLLVRSPFSQPIWSNIIDFTNTSNHTFVLSSIVLFPYLFVIILGRHFWLNRSHVKLYIFSEKLLLLFGFILTAVSLINPLVRTVNLTLSTLTLAYELDFGQKSLLAYILR